MSLATWLRHFAGEIGRTHGEEARADLKRAAELVEQHAPTEEAASLPAVPPMSPAEEALAAPLPDEPA